MSARTTTITGTVRIPAGNEDRRLALIAATVSATVDVDEQAAKLNAVALWDTATISVERAQVETRTLTGPIRTMPGRHTVTVTVSTLLPEDDRDAALAEAQPGDTAITSEAQAE